jgi:inorganic pyrophosphatase
MNIDQTSGPTRRIFYPCNYGFIPHTLAEDGDPVDVKDLEPEKWVELKGWAEPDEAHRLIIEGMRRA